MWIADRRTAVYRINAAGTILYTVIFKTSSDLEVTGPRAIEIGPDSNLYVNYPARGNYIQVFSPEGDYTRSIMADSSMPSGANDFSFAPDGTLFFQGAGIGWITEEAGEAVAHEFAAEFMAQQVSI